MEQRRRFLIQASAQPGQLGLPHADREFLPDMVSYGFFEPLALLLNCRSLESSFGPELSCLPHRRAAVADFRGDISFAWGVNPKIYFWFLSLPLWKSHCNHLNEFAGDRTLHISQLARFSALANWP